jgi:uncharacterized membrane protein YsdA (DUF1294 family)
MWIIYLLLINAIGFFIMLVDKRKAIKNRWRIPEKTLFLIALAGGSVGALVGMYCFRHKTKHKSFTIGIPAILILQLSLLVFLYAQK